MIENIFLLTMVAAVVCIFAAVGGWLIERVEHWQGWLSRVHYTWRRGRG